MSDDRLRMTPGPTEVPAAVRERMSEPMPNPDIEPGFFAFYRDLLEKLAAIYGDDDIAILGGEGILGLEAAIASLVEPGDRVLCIANGLYGEGFADFVEMAGGEAVVCDAPWREPLDLETIESHLAADSFDVATMVHCETPTGVLNDIEPVLEVLDDHDVISVVDAVSSLGGTAVPTDKIDVCLGASQKCFSAPPGLTVCSISDHAWDKIESVETPSLYTDLEPWRDAAEKEWFPYTHLVSNLYGLDTAIDLLLEEGLEHVFERHEKAAAHCRDRAADLGLSLYPDEAQPSPTVTALEIPGRAQAVQSAMTDDHDIVLATGLGDLSDDILRIGHMGHNARLDRVDRTMDALAAVLE